MVEPVVCSWEVIRKITKKNGWKMQKVKDGYKFTKPVDFTRYNGNTYTLTGIWKVGGFEAYMETAGGARYNEMALSKRNCYYHVLEFLDYIDKNSGW